MAVTIQSSASGAQWHVGRQRARWQAGFDAWRDRKLAAHQTFAGDLIVELKNPLALNRAEFQTLRQRIHATNMAIYAFPPSRVLSKNDLKQFGLQLGLMQLDKNPLADDDGISSLHSVDAHAEHGFIPYSQSALNWHTDGYYNSPDRQIGAFIIHCQQAAAQGGENALLDHEIAYALLHEANPEWTQALMSEDAMTVPAYIQAGRELRSDRPGPVFSQNRDGSLHMRYTARTRSIYWSQNTTIRGAQEFLSTLLNSNSDFIIRHRLQAGQGVLCNNVLHNRSAYEDNDAQQRLLLRARYYDRIRIE